MLYLYLPAVSVVKCINIISAANLVERFLKSTVLSICLWSGASVITFHVRLFGAASKAKCGQTGPSS